MATATAPSPPSTSSPTLQAPGRAPRVLPALRRLNQSLPTKAKVGLVLFGFFLLIAIIGPALAPYNPSATTLQTTALPPNSHHLLGTASDGGDVLSQMLVGMGPTLLLGLLTGVIATVVAVLVGVSAGFLGGATDEGLSLLANVFLVLPGLPLLIVVLGYLRNSGMLPVAVVLSALGWAWGARVIRAQTLTLRNRDYVLAARETGERTWRIIIFEILPNQVSLIAASFVGTVLYAILTSVALAFIGLIDLNGWSLGTMLYWAESQEAVQLGAWWWYIPPGLSVALIGMSLVLINFGLDEISNPRLRDGARRKIKGARWRAADPTPVVREQA